MQHERHDLIAGIWKFTDRIPAEDLISLAEEWVSEDPNYLQLFVRKCSKDQFGICFTYKTEDSKWPHRNYSEYFDKMTDTLKRGFGNEFVGWDVSCPIYLIK